MRKLLRFVLVSVMLLTSGMSFAQAYKTLTFPDDDKANNKIGAYDKTWTAKIGSDSWTIANFNNNNWSSWSYIRCGTKKDVSVASIATDFAIDKAIGNVTVAIDKVNETGKINSIKMEVASDANFSQIVETVNADAALQAGSLVFTIKNPVAGKYYRITFDMQKTVNNGLITVSKVEYNEPGSSSKQPALISWSATSRTVTLGNEDTYTFPTFNNPNNRPVTFTSSETSVATISSEGAITIIGAGETTISASSDASDVYDAGLASFKLIVKDAAPVVTEAKVPYEEPFATGQGSFTIDDVNLAQGLNFVWKHDKDYKYMKASAYISSTKTNYASESWLVSPTIDMTNCSDATLSFKHAVNKYFTNITQEATLWVKEVNGQWKQIEIASYPATDPSSGWSAFEDFKTSLNSYVGKKIQIGFKYTSTDKGAGTWEIRNFSVTGTTTGINGVQAEQANDGVTYNLAGQRVSSSYKGAVIRNGVKFIQK